MKLRDIRIKRAPQWLSKLLFRNIIPEKCDTSVQIMTSVECNEILNGIHCHGDSYRPLTRISKNLA